MIHVKPISEKEFREVAKGCGIKYKNKIPSRELKAMLGYRSLNNRMVEIRDEEGNREIFYNMRRAATESGLSNASHKIRDGSWQALREKEIRQEEILCERDLKTHLFSILKCVKKKGAGPYSREYLIIIMRVSGSSSRKSDLRG